MTIYDLDNGPFMVAGTVFVVHTTHYLCSIVCFHCRNNSMPGMTCMDKLTLIRYTQCTQLLIQTLLEAY